MGAPFVDIGSGDPLVLVPGIQGRWEYMRATVDALSRAFRVLTFSLPGRRAARIVGQTRGLADDADVIGKAMDQAGVTRAAVCGVSYGGLVALRFAATHPDRTAALVLVSTPGPGWHLRPRHRTYARFPHLFGPPFLMETLFRLRPEVRAAIPSRRDRRKFTAAQLRTFLTAPVSLGALADRALLMGSESVEADCARVTASTLVMTGEPDLDHVVPVDGSSSYARMIPGARSIVIERTGHLGSMTQPERFADEVTTFVRSVKNAGAAA